ncbi:protein kinase family protein [Pseudonocardia hispaniensis]|uniref:Protein kinase family protein n=1 Tax=Pseudonocardia hispaniensis TaxID=904933 RepID=A0ABW1J5Q3_9PSEU
MSGQTEQRPAIARSMVTATVVPEQNRITDEPDHRPPHPEPNRSGPGTMLAGRYRLHVRVGAQPRAGVEFWQAEDIVLQRDVAVTVLRRLAGDPQSDDPDGTARAGEMIVRALRAGCFEHPGCARLLDVLAPGTGGMPPDVLGAAVAEWVPGQSLAEFVSGGLIKPVKAARILEPLASAAEAAHQRGLTLGCDDPQRIRITPDGRAQLCFLLTRPDVSLAEDVRGLGGLLYALLTSRWPLSVADAARAGLATADHAADGNGPVAPSALRPGVPVELDALASGTLGSSDSPVTRVHTAAAVHRTLAEVCAEADRNALFPPAHDGVPPEPEDVWQDGGRRRQATDPGRRRKLAIGLALLGAGMLVVLGYLGVQLGAMFGDSSGPRIVVGSPVPPSDAATTQPTPADDSTRSVAAAGVEVFDPTGDPDNAGRISRVIDGNLSTSWRTYAYRQQFPALKPGVGIMVSFASAVQLSSLSIDSPSAGSVVQIRSAPAAEAPFNETVPITEVTLGSGATQVSLADSQPVQHLLIWITKLGGGGEENATEINELRFQRVGH